MINYGHHCICLVLLQTSTAIGLFGATSEALLIKYGKHIVGKLIDELQMLCTVKNRV